MPKLTAIYEYRKDGSKNAKGYRVALQKTECERCGFDENTEFEAKYFEDKIILNKIN